MSVRQYLIMILVCISLIVNDSKHLFMCILAVCVSLERCLFRSFFCFSLGLCAFLLLSCKSYLICVDFGLIFTHKIVGIFIGSV